jgi:hypothetical protein
MFVWLNIPRWGLAEFAVGMHSLLAGRQACGSRPVTSVSDARRAVLGIRRALYDAGIQTESPYRMILGGPR